MKLTAVVILLAFIAPAALAQRFDSLALAQGTPPCTPGTLGIPGSLAGLDWRCTRTTAKLT
jgi:hypothetical protein